MADRKWKQAQPRGLTQDSLTQEGDPRPGFSPAFLFPSPDHGAARLPRESPDGWLAADRALRQAGRQIALSTAVFRHDLSAFNPKTFDPTAFGSGASGAAMPV